MQRPRFTFSAILFALAVGASVNPALAGCRHHVLIVRKPVSGEDRAVVVKNLWGKKEGGSYKKIGWDLVVDTLTPQNSLDWTSQPSSGLGPLKINPSCRATRHRFKVEWYCQGDGGWQDRSETMEASEKLPLATRSQVEMATDPNQTLTKVLLSCSGELSANLVETTSWP